MAKKRSAIREEAKKFLVQEVRYLKDAPRLNGCAMTEDWQTELDRWTYVLELIGKDEVQ